MTILKLLYFNYLLKNRNLIALTISGILTISNLFSQDYFSPPIQTYSPKTYQAGISNWDIAQSPEGIMYFGNLSGLLQFDGWKWNLINIGENTVARSILIDEQGRIFIGKTNDVGFVDLDSIGQPIYYSFRQISDNIKIGISAIVQILNNSKEVYFIASDNLYMYDGLGLQSIELANAEGGFIFQDTLYIKERDFRIRKLKGDELVEAENMIDKPQFIRNNYFYNKDSSAMTFIDQSGVYLLSNNQFEKFNSTMEWESVITGFHKSVNDSEEKYWISTGSKGLSVAIDWETIQFQFNSTNGIKSDIIFKQFKDREEAIWLGQQQGVSRLATDEFIMHWGEGHNFDQVVLGQYVYGGKTFIGTFGGLYQLGNKSIFLSKDLNYRIWNLKEINNQLYVIASEKLLIIDSQDSEKVIDIPMFANIFQLSSGELVINSIRNGIRILNDNSTSGYIDEIKGNCYSVISNNDQHWLSYKFTGVYFLDENNGQPKWKLFNKQHGLADLEQIKILKNSQGDLFFTGNKGLYTLNEKPKSDSTDLFIPYQAKIFGDLNIEYADIDRNDNFWMIVRDKNNQSSIIKLEKFENGQYQKLDRFYKRIPNQSFSFIQVDKNENHVIWASGTEGLYRIDDHKRPNIDLAFNSFISQVQLNDSIIHRGLYRKKIKDELVPAITSTQTADAIPVVPFEWNSIKFEYSALYFEQPERNEFAVFLEGYDKEWSNWSVLNRKEYTNLPAGNYTFKVKSKNIYDTESNIATYKFTILPPWYQTSWAYFLFSLGVVGMIWIILLGYTYRVRQHRKRLKLIIADRTFEVIQQKKVIEIQLLKLTNMNEEISQQRDDIFEKNEKLQSSQSEIMAINEQLKTLNNELELRVEERTKKIKDTLEILRQTNKDLDTFIYKASHDLKGPISRIKGILALGRMGDLDETNTQYYDMIDRTTSEMSNMLAKLTQVHEVFNNSLKKERIGLPAIIKDCIDQLQHLIHDKVKFEFELVDDNQIVTDPELIRLLIFNLLENSLIYYDEDSQELLIKISATVVSKQLIIEVSDNGIGIQADLQEKVYGMFFRGSSLSKGSGLGLYLVHIAAEKLNAKVSYESQPGKGTKFRLEIPV